MRRSWLKFSLLVFLLASIFFIGSKHIAWASSDAAPLNQCGTVPCRTTSTPTLPSPTSEPPTIPAPTKTQAPRPVIPTATYTLRVATLKPTHTNTETAAPTKPAPTRTITQPVATVAVAVIMTSTFNGSVVNSLPRSTPVSGSSMLLPTTGGLLLVLLGVLGIIIWRKRTR